MSAILPVPEKWRVHRVRPKAGSTEEISQNSKSELQITYGTGGQFSINKAEDEVSTNHQWNDKQITSRSEHREYSGPTAAPSATLASIRANHPAGNQSLLGDSPSDSQLVSSSTYTTLYTSPSSDVAKTVKNSIEPYHSDGGINAPPILYRYSEAAAVNTSAEVVKTGVSFTGGSTLRSKATFSETDNGTIQTYRGLERQDASSQNNWTITYVPIETPSGGIAQTITHTKPAADNTITIPNQGT
ncbi:MAG: hypothetical protein JNL67_20590, partial [Planctomycetaceae bacterium]|nr:hypothetical protein [Planctomycetaceae bacterium]